MRRGWRLNLVAGLAVMLVAGSGVGHEPPRWVAAGPLASSGERNGDLQAQHGTRALRLELVDERGEATAGLIRISTMEGRAVGIGGVLSRGTQLRRGHPAHEWYAVKGPVTIEVPRMLLRVEATRGIETGVAIRTIEAGGPEVVEMPLRRLDRMADRNWIAGNTHLHLRRMSREEADEYLRTVSAADELGIVFVTHATRPGADVDYISNAYTAEALRELAASGVLFGYGQEHRHNFGPGGEGYGHVMLLNLERLIEPVSVGPGITRSGDDGTPLRAGLRAARQQGGSVIWAHNDFGYEDIPSFLAGLVDAQNIFDGGNKGSYEDTFYRYLNLGLRVPFSAGTDWFIYDFSRVYVQVEGEADPARWLEALKTGRTFITNEPLLEFSVGGVGTGGSIELDQAADLMVEARGVGRSAFGRLELIHNGRVIHAVDSARLEDHFAAELRLEVRVDGPGWLAVRVNGEGRNIFDQPIFAHTSPVYVRFAGRDVFDGQTARETIEKIELEIGAIEAHGKFASDGEQRKVMSIYREAIDTLRRRLDER